MSLPSQQERWVDFIRGFFGELDRLEVPSAALHDWRSGSEGMQSDVDFVVGELWVGRIPALVEGYCERMGWRLCQVLWHETTAAYCICSAQDDPECVVALDGCSHYQRNGVVLMTAGELLDGRLPSSDGGSRQGEDTELRYRFIKAAIKSKDPEVVAGEFAAYPDEAKLRCQEWVTSRWGIDGGGWDAESLRSSLERLEVVTGRRGGMPGLAEWRRIAGRLMRPTGLVVVCPAGTGSGQAEEIRRVFGRFYFRHVMEAERWPARGFQALARSTLMILPALSRPLRALLGARLVIDLGAEAAGKSPRQEVAEHLHRRCLHREGIS